MFSECKTDYRLRDLKAYCMSLQLGCDLRLSYDRISHVLIANTKTAMSAHISEMGCFGGKETANPVTE